MDEKLTPEQQQEYLVSAFESFQGNPFVFLEEVWGLTPQPVLHKYKGMMERLYTTPAQYFNLEVSLFSGSMFGEFVNGKHITWQQTMLVIAVYRAINGTLPWKISIKSGRGSGKAVRLNTPIYKIENEKIIVTQAGEIKAGDVILGKDKPTKVTHILPQPKMQMYQITFDDKSTIDVTGSHLWTISDGQVRKRLNKRVGYDKNSEENKWETIDTDEMIKRGTHLWGGDRERRFRLPIQKVEGFLNVPDAYVIGVWYGDGSKGKSMYTKPDEFIAEKIRSLGYKVGEQNKSGARNIYKLIYRLRELGEHVPQKEGLPCDFLSWNFESRKALLRGLMDTDGFCDTTGGAEFSSSIPTLAKDVQTLIRSLGGKTNIRIKETTFYNDKNGERVYCKPSHRLTVSTTFNPFTLPKKADRYTPPTQDRYLYRFIDTIEPVAVEESVCFVVDAPDMLFLAGEGLIVTHNSNIVAKLALWFLYSFSLCRVMATAPNSELLSAVLWSEMSTAINNAKEPYQSSFKWQSDYIRMTQDPIGWFARAKTSRPGEKGALSGLHADHMMSLVDESAEVEKDVIDTAMHTMTNDGKKLMILISNPHISTGYFKDTFTDPDWINLTFNCEDSPIVSHESVESVAKKYGRDSDEYKVSVLGEFPSEGILSESSDWVRKYSDKWINAFFNTDGVKKNTLYENHQLEHPSHRTKQRLNRPYLGVDVGGEGGDSSEIYARDNTRASHVASEATSDSASVAKLTIRAMDELDTDPADTTVDNFGVGANVAADIALASDKDSFVVGLNVGDKCSDTDDRDVYGNERARLADLLLQWGVQGGRCDEDPILREELETIYTRNQNGKQVIMGKKEMAKLKLKSPNRVDALWLTFPQDKIFNIRVPRGDQLYYPDRDLPEKEVKKNPANIHRMIPS